jgi:acetyl esterase/lipase
MKNIAAMRNLLLSLFALVVISSSIGYSQKVTIEYLWPRGAPDARGDSTGDKPTLTFFFPAAEKSNGTAVVICPGGTYRGLAAHEGDPVAEWFNSFGVTGIVLRYRHAKSGAGYHHPTPLLDAQHSLSMIRSRAK